MAEKVYRDIRPSFGDPSRSPTLPDVTTEAGRTSPDPRRKTNDAPKHRKVPESVTRNACLNCKKARAKCDGKTPCKRCSTRSESHECIYEIHLKHAKEDLVKQIKELQARDLLSKQIFHALSSKVNVSEILEMISNGDDLETIVKAVGGKPGPLSDTMSITPSPAISPAEVYEKAELAATYWTSVTSDKAVLDHLFQLYFSWIHPVHTFLHEGQFVQSYHAVDAARQEFCSSLLVNALCALACHLHHPTSDDLVDFNKLGIEFAEAACMAMEIDDHRPTTLQAYAAMFLVEVTRGNALLASSYLDIAVKSLARVEQRFRDEASDVWKCMVWGFQELNVEWAQMTFRVPYAIDMSSVRGNAADDERLDMMRWHIYSRPSGVVNSWPSLQATTTRQKAELLAIIEDITTLLYSERAPPISAGAILICYERLVLWREKLAEILDIDVVNSGHGLPHILSLLILYSSSVAQLLQPVLVLDGFPKHLVEDIIWTHAQQGFQFLGNQYRSQFPLHCQSVLQMYSLMHLVDVIARYFPGGIEGYSIDGPQAIKMGINILEESAQNVPMAAIMQEMLRMTAQSCSIRLSSGEQIGNSETQAPRKKYTLNDFIQACTRPSFTQPVFEVSRRFNGSFTEDWLARSEQSKAKAAQHSIPSSVTEPGAQRLMLIRNLLN